MDKQRYNITTKHLENISPLQVHLQGPKIIQWYFESYVGTVSVLGIIQKRNLKYLVSVEFQCNGKQKLTSLTENSHLKFYKLKTLSK